MEVRYVDGINLCNEDRSGALEFAYPSWLPFVAPTDFSAREEISLRERTPYLRLFVAVTADDDGGDSR